jgi:hypothetical protein
MNTEILNWSGPPWEGDYRGVMNTGRDEPIGVIIHICMETTQGISLYSYLYLKQKHHVFLFYILCFFFYRIKEQEGRTGSAVVWRHIGNRGREDLGGRKG